MTTNTVKISVANLQAYVGIRDGLEPASRPNLTAKVQAVLLGGVSVDEVLQTLDEENRRWFEFELGLANTILFGVGDKQKILSENGCVKLKAGFFDGMLQTQYGWKINEFPDATAFQLDWRSLPEWFAGAGELPRVLIIYLQNYPWPITVKGAKLLGFRNLIQLDCLYCDNIESYILQDLDTQVLTGPRRGKAPF